MEKGRKYSLIGVVRGKARTEGKEGRTGIGGKPITGGEGRIVI